MKSWLRFLWPFGWTGVAALVVAVSSFLLATHELGAWPWIDRRPLRERYLFRHVSRIDLNPVLNAPGRLESARMTVVRCELENIAGASGGGSTILTLVPEGTHVKHRVGTGHCRSPPDEVTPTVCDARSDEKVHSDFPDRRPRP